MNDFQYGTAFYYEGVAAKYCSLKDRDQHGGAFCGGECNNTLLDMTSIWKKILGNVQTRVKPLAGRQFSSHKSRAGQPTDVVEKRIWLLTRLQFVVSESR